MKSGFFVEIKTDAGYWARCAGPFADRLTAGLHRQEHFAGLGTTRVARYEAPAADMPVYPWARVETYPESAA